MHGSEKHAVNHFNLWKNPAYVKVDSWIFLTQKQRKDIFMGEKMYLTLHSSLIKKI